MSKEKQIPKKSLWCRAVLLFSIVLFSAFHVNAGLGPRASFTADMTAIAVGETVAVDASASRDSRGTSNLQYRWDFESTYEWTMWSRNPRATHIFKEAGEKTIRLEIKDNDGYTDETKVLIRVKATTGNLGPISSFSISPLSGDTNTSFEFEITSVSQIGTPTGDLQFRWDFECDGKFDTDYTYSTTAYHSFATVGSKEVCLETLDRDGTTAVEHGYYVTGKEDDQARTKEIGRIIVDAGTAPRASFRTYPTSGVIGTNVHFEAGASYNAQEYRFDFEGDGKFDTSWSKTNKIQHIYTRTGSYRPVLEVRSVSGEVDRTERLVTIIEEDSILPTAEFTVRNLTNSLNHKAGTIQDRFYFDASRSKSGSGSNAKLRVRWDFEGDGKWETTFSVSKIAYHNYETKGKFRPRIEILDDEGNTAEAETELEIVENSVPVAVLTVNPLLATKEKEFTFDAGKSFDAQSRSSDLEYRFDFDGDGIWDTVFSKSRTARRRFAMPGKKSASLEVRDPGGLTTKAKTNFEIADPTAPLAKFSVTPTSGTFGTNFQFDARGSSDPSGVGGRLFFRWDFTSSGGNDLNFDTSWSPTPTVTHHFTTPGLVRIRLQVKNEAEQVAEFNQTVLIHPESEYLDFLAKRGVMQNANPDQLLNRAELAKVVIKAAGLPVKYSNKKLFTDVVPTVWYAPFAAAVVERGWLAPLKNYTFRPTAPVSRAEAVKVVLSALYPRVVEYREKTHFSDVLAGAWYYRFANLAAAEELGFGKEDRFFPDKAVTRGELARAVAKLTKKYEIAKYRLALAKTFLPQGFMSSILDSLTLRAK